MDWTNRRADGPVPVGGLLLVVRASLPAYAARYLRPAVRAVLSTDQLLRSRCSSLLPAAVELRTATAHSAAELVAAAALIISS
jgi:hypothetical protein